MNIPNFFCSLHALKVLTNSSRNKGNKKTALPMKPVKMTMDLIELPLWVSFSASPTKAMMKVFPRNDVYGRSKTHGSELGRLVAERESGRVRITVNHVSLMESMSLLFTACCNLSKYSEERILLKCCTRLDPEREGILLTVNGGEPNFQIVCGKERPELMCMKLGGKAAMCRPYAEDLSERHIEIPTSADELLEAAEGGNESAIRLLSYAYLNGDAGLSIPKDPDRAAKWIRRLAEADACRETANAG